MWILVYIIPRTCICKIILKTTKFANPEYVVGINVHVDQSSDKDLEVNTAMCVSMVE